MLWPLSYDITFSINALDNFYFIISLYKKIALELMYFVKLHGEKNNEEPVGHMLNPPKYNWVK